MQALLDAAAALKRARRRGHGWDPLRGRHLALLIDCHDEDTQAFQRAVHDLGASVALLDASDWRSSAGERVPDAARMLGRLYDAIDCCGLPMPLLEQIDANCGVPVFNGMAQADHLLGVLAALLTMREAGDKPLTGMRVQLAGDARAPRAQVAATLVQLAGIAVRREAAASGAPGVAIAATSGAPDFILDPFGAPASEAALTMPEASLGEQARIVALLASNRHCALQAALVCGVH